MRFAISLLLTFSHYGATMRRPTSVNLAAQRAAYWNDPSSVVPLLAPQ
jgi:hypothetical protein